MANSRFGSVIFDFDYTLVDSSNGIIDSVNHALSALGLPTAPDDEIRATIGLTMTDTFRRLTADKRSELFPEFFDLFVQRADGVMAQRATVIDHVPQVIEQLASSGFRLGIVSTKFRYRIEAILAREGLLDAFDVIIGGEDVSTHKPDPEGLLRAITSLETDKTNCLYVGDSVTDAETSRRADVPFAAVLSGVTPQERFAACAASIRSSVIVSAS